MHGDPWPGNAIHTAQDQVTLIDWENAGLGLPLLDLGFCLLECHLDVGPPGNQPSARHIQPDENRVSIEIEKAPHLLFYKRLNPGSLFAAAYEVCVFPLAESIAQRRRWQRQIIGAGFGLLLVGLLASQFASARLSRPVEQLAVESEQNRAQRAHAEAELATRSVELQRSASTAGVQHAEIGVSNGRVGDVAIGAVERIGQAHADTYARTLFNWKLLAHSELLIERTRPAQVVDKPRCCSHAERNAVFSRRHVRKSRGVQVRLRIKEIYMAR